MASLELPERDEGRVRSVHRSLDFRVRRRAPEDGDLGFGRIVNASFRKRGTEYVNESGMKRMNGGAKRQCDRALQ
jgi:hypothetical protein